MVIVGMHGAISMESLPKRSGGTKLRSAWLQLPRVCSVRARALLPGASFRNGFSQKELT